MITSGIVSLLLQLLPFILLLFRFHHVDRKSRVEREASEKRNKGGKKVMEMFISISERTHIDAYLLVYLYHGNHKSGKYVRVLLLFRKKTSDLNVMELLHQQAN